MRLPPGPAVSEARPAHAIASSPGRKTKSIGVYTISNSRIKLGSNTSANETPAAVALPSSERAAFTKTSYLRWRGGARQKNCAELRAEKCASKRQRAASE